MFELRDLAAEDVGTPEVIDSAPLRGGHQPRDRVVRDARGRPLLERSDEGVLRQVLGEAHIAGHPGEGTDEAGRLGPPGGVDGLARIIGTGLCRHHASVVSPVSAWIRRSLPQRAQDRRIQGHSPGASGPVEIWRRVEITVISGQYFA